MNSEVSAPGLDQLLAATERHAQAAALLSSALVGEASHAYLFSGPRGVGKREAARAFAAGLLAAGASDPEDARARAMRGAHPDLTWVKPSGAHEMRLNDVAEPVVRAATRTPIEGTRRVFVLERAHTMSEAVANSLLKTLEEPAEFACFILISDRPERLLETIVSRCQLVRFDAVPADVIAAELVESGVEPLRAASCAALSGGDVELARELSSDEGDAMRSEAGRIVGCALADVSGRERPWEAVLARAVAAGELAESAVLARLQQTLEDLPRGRERTAAQKEGEQAATRAARRARSDTLDRSLRISSLLLRDLAVAAAGADDLLMARDREASILRSGRGRALGPLLDAAAAVEAARGSFGQNVSEELALQALCFRLDQLLAAGR